MKRISPVLAVIICVTAACLLNMQVAAAPVKSPQQEYIARYSKIAVEEMYRSGVPASITLAQGLLESGYGRSELAVKGNNHFGIKCHDWKGPSMRFDDDRKGECFRKYEHAEASFMDHSDFLRYRDRYKFLFDLETTDYRGWAYGLKKAGYATDPQYPQKLIKLIEEYDLSRFDKASPDDISSRGDAAAVKADVHQGGKASSRKGSKSSGKHKETRSSAKKSRKPKALIPPRQIPEPPLMLESPVAMEKDRAEKFKYQLSRRLYSQNNVPFVYSVEGETYSSLARKYDLFPAEILKFND
ncbi:MAG: glucosaminidase domain-containing protein, partial [Clostridium sp.]|nr:glucosaminidase domain-containing protein [Clostridium sp.]